MRVVCLGALALLGSAPVEARSAAQEMGTRPASIERRAGFPGAVIVVPVDDTGIADWAYLNPRRPPYVFDRYDKAIAERAPSEDQVALGNLVRGLGDCTDQKLHLVSSPMDNTRAAALTQALRDVVAEPLPLHLAFANRSANRDLTVTVSLEIRQEKISELVSEVTRAGAMLERSAQAEARTLAKQAGRLTDLVGELRGLTSCPAPRLTPTPQPSPSPGPRTDEAVRALREQVEAAHAALAFFGVGPGLCSPKPDGKTCTFTLRVLRSTTQAVDLWHVIRISAWDVKMPSERKPGVVSFSASFFPEAEQPSNPTGSVSLVPSQDLQEGDGRTSHSLSLSVGGSIDPDLGTDAAPIPIGPDSPYRGAKKSHFPGLGQAAVEYALGKRASGTLELAFKRGDLGGTDAAGTVAATKYRVNVYGLNDLSLSLGKFVFAGPSSQIAAREAGEGFAFRFRRLELGHVVKRESNDRVSNDADRDNTSWVFQVRGVPLGARVGTVSLFGVLGREEKTEEAGPGVDEAKRLRAHAFGTAGFDLSFGMPSANVVGNFGAYYSRRTAIRDSGAMRGEGFVSLLTLSRSWNAPAAPLGSEVKVTRTLTARVGYGTGDRASSAETDEGYVGENTAFQPDVLFLSALTDRMVTGGAGTAGRGLSNKSYLGLTYTDQTFSPLEWVATLIGAGDDVEARATTLTWHLYRFNEPVLGSRDAGHEVDLEFQMTAPKGVKFSVTLSRFLPGAALDRLFKEEPWALVSSVSLRL